MDNSTPGMEEKLVQYLDGELDPSQKADVEAALAANPAWQEELERLQATREALRRFGLQQKVAGIHSAMMEELQPRISKTGATRRFFRYASAIAAGVLLLVGAFIAYNFFTLTPGKVFSSRYKVYELSNLRDGDSTVVSVVVDAYSRKNYREVVNTFYNRPFTPKENLLRGMAYMELQDDSSAILVFQRVISDLQSGKENLLKNDAEYYKALACIRLKKYEEALPLLQAIRNDPGHLYYDKVTAKLIRQVKMLRRR